MSFWPYYTLLVRIDQKLDLLLRGQGQLQQQETQAMAVLDDLEAKLAAEETVEASVITLLQELSTELKAALAANDPARIQAVITKMDTDTQAMAAAVTANTPPPGP